MEKTKQLFRFFYKTGYALNEQVIEADNFKAATDLANEYCREFGFIHINTSPFIFDMQGAIDRKRKRDEGIST